MRNVHTDLLLFGVERTENAAILYFVERNTIDGDIPLIHRMGAPKHVIDKIELGGLYTVTESRKRILNMELQKLFRLTEPYFVMLNELRCLKYDKRRFVPEDSLSFPEFHDLLAYRCGFWKKAEQKAVCAAFYLVGLLLPCALYVFAMFTLIQLKVSLPAFVPVLSVGLLPLMVFIIALSFAVCEWALLELSFTRFSLLRAFALETCGAKRPIGVTKKMRRRLAWLGAAAAAAIVLSALTLFLCSAFTANGGI